MTQNHHKTTVPRSNFVKLATRKLDFLVYQDKYRPAIDSQVHTPTASRRFFIVRSTAFCCVYVQRKKLCNCLCSCFFLPSRRCLSNGLAKVIFPMFHHSFPRERVTRIEPFSLDNFLSVFSLLYNFAYVTFTCRVL